MTGNSRIREVKLIINKAKIFGVLEVLPSLFVVGIKNLTKTFANILNKLQKLYTCNVTVNHWENVYNSNIASFYVSSPSLNFVIAPQRIC